MANESTPRLDLKTLVREAQLPALPQSAIQLLELSQNTEIGPAEFTVPIEVDPGLASQVLRFVNSSYFGFSGEISSVKLAITLVGVRTIKNFALWSAVFSLMPNPKCGPFRLKRLWTDSLRRALFARAMAELLGVKEVEEPFAAALLQDMAVPVLAKEQPALYLKLFEARENGKYRLSFLEQQWFGWTHAEAAGMMARHWKLPNDFAALLENHHALDRLVRQAEPPTGLAVALSALLPATADPRWEELGEFEDCYRVVCPAGGPSVAELLDRVDREFAEFAPVLKLSTPGKSLIESYNAVTAAAT